jgi:hypothetical protein
MLQKQHNHRHSNQPRSERRIKGKELQDIDVSGRIDISGDDPDKKKSSCAPVN